MEPVTTTSSRFVAVWKRCSDAGGCWAELHAVWSTALVTHDAITDVESHPIANASMVVFEHSIPEQKCIRACVLLRGRDEVFACACSKHMWTCILDNSRSWRRWVRHRAGVSRALTWLIQNHPCRRHANPLKDAEIIRAIAPRVKE